jgi:hypothetical protein
MKNVPAPTVYRTYGFFQKLDVKILITSPKRVTSHTKMDVVINNRNVRSKCHCHTVYCRKKPPNEQANICGNMLYTNPFLEQI